MLSSILEVKFYTNFLKKAKENRLSADKVINKDSIFFIDKVFGKRFFGK